MKFHESANTLYSEDGTFKPDDPRARMMNHLMEACEKIGRTMDPAPHYKKWCEDAGFVNTKQERIPLPVGPWPKDPV